MSYYQQKHKMSKNGKRIGRPPVAPKKAFTVRLEMLPFGTLEHLAAEKGVSVQKYAEGILEAHAHQELCFE